MKGRCETGFVCLFCLLVYLLPELCLETSERSICFHPKLLVEAALDCTRRCETTFPQPVQSPEPSPKYFETRVAQAKISQCLADKREQGMRKIEPPNMSYQIGAACLSAPHRLRRSIRLFALLRSNERQIRFCTKFVHMPVQTHCETATDVVIAQTQTRQLS